jgi:creatinine amidohydrolase
MASERFGQIEGVKVIAITDLSILVNATLVLGAELGIPASEGGIHGGEWETSMMLAVNPELVHMERAVSGYTGDLEAGMQRFFAEGVDALTDTGVIGDPKQASAENGRRYFDRLVELAIELVEKESV